MLSPLHHPCSTRERINACVVMLVYKNAKSIDDTALMPVPQHYKNRVDVRACSDYSVSILIGISTERSDMV